MKKLNENSLPLKIAYLFESLLAIVVLITVFLGTIDTI